MSSQSRSPFPGIVTAWLILGPGLCKEYAVQLLTGLANKSGMAKHSTIDLKADMGNPSKHFNSNTTYSSYHLRKIEYF